MRDGVIISRLSDAAPLVRSGIALALTLAMTSCAPEDRLSPPTNEQPSRASTGSTTEPWARYAPTVLNNYFYNTEELVTVDQAEGILIRSCMRSRGFKYSTPPRSQMLEGLRQSELEADSRLFGITDARVASKFGYMPASLYLGNEDQPSSTGGDSSEYVKALYGKDFPAPGSRNLLNSDIESLVADSDGCIYQSRRRLSGDSNGTSDHLGRSLWIEAYMAAQKDAQWGAVVFEWGSCLEESGYQVTDILNDAGDIRKYQRRDSARAASKEEIELALEDISCKKRVDLVRRLNEIFKEYALESVHRNQKELSIERKRLDQVLRRCRAVIVSGSAP